VRQCSNPKPQYYKNKTKQTNKRQYEKEMDTVILKHSHVITLIWKSGCQGKTGPRWLVKATQDMLELAQSLAWAQKELLASGSF
jgi:hypothetical protein